MNDFYTLTSPHFPAHKDFERWNLWCEWHDAAELTELNLSDTQINEHFHLPNSDGLEVYYPMVQNTLSQNCEFLFAQAKFTFITSDDVYLLNGHLSLVKNEVISATILTGETEVTFYGDDRIVAEDENPKSIASICRTLNVDPFRELSYESPVTGGDGLPLRGAIRLF